MYKIKLFDFDIFYFETLNRKSGTLDEFDCNWRFFYQQRYFFRKRAAALEFAAISLAALFSVIRRCWRKISRGTQTSGEGTSSIRFLSSRLARLPAEDRRDGPSEPIPSGECWRIKTASDISAFLWHETRPGPKWGNYHFLKNVTTQFKQTR